MNVQASSSIESDPEARDDDETTRFETELEFLHALSSPSYLRFLGRARYFDDPQFMKYLAYLQYWHRPEYAILVARPTALTFLRMLVVSPSFRRSLCNDPEFEHELFHQQFFDWYAQDGDEPRVAMK